jgi:lipopolysaccharide export system permease protein
VVLSLGRMYRDSEMAVWFSSGIGLARFAAPVVRMAWPVLLVIGILLIFVWPWGNRSSTEIRQRYEQRSDLSRVAPGVFQTSRDGNRVFFIDRASQEGHDGHNVFIVTRKAQVESVTAARTGRLEVLGNDRMLVLENGQRNEVDHGNGARTLASFEDYRVLADERASRDAGARPPRTLDTVALLRDPTPRHQGELAWRFGLLFAAANLLLLGIGLSATNPRRASNWNLLFALLAFVVYFNLINLSQAWIAGGRMAFGPMMLLLHGGGLALALGLIWWRDHGASLLAAPRKAAA